jgi:hypothetical protein
VRGQLYLQDNILEVEKIWVRQAEEPFKQAFALEDLAFDGEDYRRAIAQRGKLEPALDVLVS